MSVVGDCNEKFQSVAATEYVKEGTDCLPLCRRRRRRQPRSLSPYGKHTHTENTPKRKMGEGSPKERQGRKRFTATDFRCFPLSLSVFPFHGHRAPPRNSSCFFLSSFDPVYLSQCIWNGNPSTPLFPLMPWIKEWNRPFSLCCCNLLFHLSFSSGSRQ